MNNYANEPRLDINIDFDQSKLRLCFKKSSLLVSVEMLYGNDVIRKFSSQKYHLNKLMEKAFSKSWDDVWLTFKVAVTQCAILLRDRKNYIIQIKNLKENDEHFNVIFTKFCIHSSDISILTELVHYVLRKLNLPEPSGSTISDCLYDFASYVITKSKLIKSKRKTVDIYPDVNKVVLTRG
jgi:hypothetical protein